MKTRATHFFVAALAFSILLSVDLPGQQSVSIKEQPQSKGPSQSFWFSEGAGPGGQALAYELSFGVEFQPGRVVTLQYDGTDSDPVSSLFFDLFGREEGTDTQSLGVQVGNIKKFRLGIMTYSAGLSWVKIADYRYTYYETPATCMTLLLVLYPCTITEAIQHIDVRNTIGLTLDFDLVLSSKWIGIGVNPFLNLNFEHSYGGLTFDLSIGKIRQ